MGIPPQTLASIARLIRAAIARSHISAPQAAISSLLAVTTDFLFWIAVLMISAAVVVPPTSSATMSTFGCETSSRQSVVLKTPDRDLGRSIVFTDRLHTAVIFKSN